MAADNFAYVADGVGGLLIFDVSDKTQLRLVGQYCAPGPGSVRDVAINGRTAYISIDSPQTYKGFRIVDLTYLNNTPLDTINQTTCTVGGGGSSPIFIKG